MKKRLNLKMAIVGTGFTQREFAKKYAIGERRLSAIISGLLNPRPVEEKAILKGLGLKANDDNLFQMVK